MQDVNLWDQFPSELLNAEKLDAMQAHIEQLPLCYVDKRAMMRVWCCIVGVKPQTTRFWRLAAPVED